eukprot:369481_1
MLSYSSIVSVVYAITNIFFLLILSVVVYIQGKHGSIFSIKFLKDVWNQRKIFGAIIIYIYDTATDAGVLYNWGELMIDEQNGVQYESVNMKAFFWGGVGCILFYRFIQMCASVAGVFMEQQIGAYPKLKKHIGKMYCAAVLVATFDVMIFLTVGLSLTRAHVKIKTNAQIRGQKKSIVNKNSKHSTEQQLAETQMISVVTTNSSPTKIDTVSDDIQSVKDIVEQKKHKEEISLKEEEIEPHYMQIFLQAIEAMFESLPQIFLQSVFIIRSANDTELRKGTNIYLILLSTIASLFSICSKWAHIDKLFIIKKKAQKINLDCCKFPNPFPYFINPWYIARIMWRLCHFLSSFSVLVLIWAVMGGWFAFFWMIIAFFTWWIVLIRAKTSVSYLYFEEWMKTWAMKRKRQYLFVPCVAVHGIGITMYRKGGYIYIFKVCQTCIGMVLITLFGMMKFDCVICADP